MRQRIDLNFPFYLSLIGLVSKDKLKSSKNQSWEGGANTRVTTCSKVLPSRIQYLIIWRSGEILNTSCDCHVTRYWLTMYCWSRLLAWKRCTSLPISHCSSAKSSASGWNYQKKKLQSIYATIKYCIIWHEKDKEIGKQCHRVQISKRGFFSKCVHKSHT